MKQSIDKYEKKIIHDKECPIQIFENNVQKGTEKSSVFGSHWHEYMELHYVLHGKLEVMHKVISRKKSISSISNLVISAIDESYEYCFIAHANCVQDALSMKEKIEAGTSIKPTIVNLGPVVGCHSGPGTLAVFFVGKENR